MFALSQSLDDKVCYQVNPPKIDLPGYWDELNDATSVMLDERRNVAAGLSTRPSHADTLDETRLHYAVDCKTSQPENEA